VKISELGEFGLIDLLASMINAATDKDTQAGRQLILGIGDDAAAWQAGDSVQLATVDALVENVHFTLETTHSTGSGQATWQELGWKALAVNLSDIAAMGGIPSYALVSLALPGQTEMEQVRALYRGIIELAQQFGVAIIGGNMSSAPLVVINITVLGSAKADKKILTRSAARSGDKVAVTGYLGASAAGLEMLSKHLPFKPEAADALKQAFLKPHPRVAEGQLLVKHGVRAAIDISDGLLSDLGHICRMSKVSARIEIERVPVHPAVKANFGDRALGLALSGGEDYELLFTASAGVIDKAKAAVKCPITVIGEVRAENAGEITLVDGKGQAVNLAESGWEHFISS